MATLQALQARIAKLQAQAEAIAKKESSTVLTKIHELLERHGLTTADVDAFRESNRKRQSGTAQTSNKNSGAAKYADPKTGATWTGHGRAPAWIANVKDRSKFLIDADKVVTKSPATKQPKAGNYVRGPQEPKYRDPQSGATWSGRGKAPGWLASAADRTAFLINASGTTSSEPAKPVAKKATAKKAAAKKSAAKKSAAKKSAAKKAVVKKAPAQKTAAKRAATKTVPTKKVAAKKVATKTAATKKASAKKIAVKKGAAKTAAVKKAPAQAGASGASEASATTAPAKKVPSKKAAAKKGAGKKVAAKEVPQAPESASQVSAPHQETGESSMSVSQ